MAKHDALKRIGRRFTLAMWVCSRDPKSKVGDIVKKLREYPSFADVTAAQVRAFFDAWGDRETFRKEFGRSSRGG